MVYRERFVAVVKHKGKILREHDDTVTLPFGSEYSILLKNLETRRASVKISIDGTDVLNGHSLVVNANSEIEIERFLKDLDKGNRFKFIEKTQEIADYRGDKIDDGFIRIEFAFEKHVDMNWLTRSYYRYSGSGYCGQSAGSPFMYDSFTVSNSISERGLSNSSDVTYTSSINESFTPKQDEGITVPGSISEQKFKTVTMGELGDEKHVIILKLRGTTKKEHIKVKAPITVRTRLTCQTCGRKSKSSMKFCGNCGTSLI